MGFFSKKKEKAEASTTHETQLEDGSTITVSAVIDYK